MKILVVTQYFWPESFIINDIVRHLHESGHEVVVATGKPNYPEGKFFSGYRFGGTQRERYLGKIEVLRVPLYARGAGGVKNLILNYLSFVLFGLVCFPFMLRKRKFDAIFVFAMSPLTQAIPAIPLKYIKRAPLTVWVQDLWPESLAATGYVKSKFALRVAGAVVKGIYAFCDKLFVQSKAFFDPVARYASRDKIVYYPNSIDATPVVSSSSIPDELIQLLEQNFCVVFAGNLGTAQALDTVVQSAISLRDEPGIRLVLVGTGSRFAWLQEQKVLHRLDNLILPGRFSMDMMPQVFERAGALLVTLNADEIFTQTIPSKVQAYLASGRPIIACLNGEGARVVVEAGAGIATPAEQAGALVETIQRMRAVGKDEREKMGRSGRAYFEAHFDMRHQVQSLAEMLKKSGVKE
ncbi:glycosyltransferase family 4 protein [Pseudomonas maumuensis]|uniref:Glycosyltransferase family 4 protein n=1 Tax=Pseudomonas maumuensis TaxID=2842354 RepID=A0ABX8NG63_9PSED|nr:glycosyltransferase family 4 protein [Pseudomonas maumuensis]QXH55419.1 glycosyltransferase family 4 protein [Pseudomonas maumuensis]